MAGGQVPTAPGRGGRSLPRLAEGAGPYRAWQRGQLCARRDRTKQLYAETMLRGPKIRCSARGSDTTSRTRISFNAATRFLLGTATSRTRISFNAATRFSRMLNMDASATIHLTLHFLFSFLPVLDGMSTASSNFRVSRQLESLRQQLFCPRCRDPVNVFTSHTPTNPSRVFMRCSNLTVTFA